MTLRSRVMLSPLISVLPLFLAGMGLFLGSFVSQTRAELVLNGAQTLAMHPTTIDEKKICQSDAQCDAGYHCTAFSGKEGDAVGPGQECLPNPDCHYRLCTEEELAECWGLCTGAASTCMPSTVLTRLAREACDGRCSEESRKCGLNSYSIGTACEEGEGYLNASFTCYDGTMGTVPLSEEKEERSETGGGLSCHSTTEWGALAKEICSGRMSAETGKMGMNSSMAGRPCNDQDGLFESWSWECYDGMRCTGEGDEYNCEEVEEEQDEDQEQEDDGDECAAKARAEVEGCLQRAAEVNGDPVVVCGEVRDNVLEACQSGFGDVPDEEEEEGGGDEGGAAGGNATGEIANILSYAVQLVIQNLSEHPDLKDAAQTLGGLIVKVAGGDLGSVVPEAIAVLEEVKRILGVSEEMQEMSGPSPEEVQERIGPMCEEMGGMLEMIENEVLPFLAENNVKPAVLEEMEKRVGALQEEFQELKGMCDQGDPKVFQSLEAFGMKMEELGEYADKNITKNVRDEADELFFAEDPFANMGPPGMMGPGMMGPPGMRGGDFGGMDPEKMQMMFQEKEGCYSRSPEEMGNCLNAIDDQYGFHPMMGPPGMMGPGMMGPPGMGPDGMMGPGREGGMPWEEGDFPGEGYGPPGGMPW